MQITTMRNLKKKKGKQNGDAFSLIPVQRSHVLELTAIHSEILGAFYNSIQQLRPNPPHPPKPSSSIGK